MVILVRAPRIQPTYLRVAQSWENTMVHRTRPGAPAHAHNSHARVTTFSAGSAAESATKSRGHGGVLRRPRTHATHPRRSSRPSSAPRITGLHGDGSRQRQW